MAYLKFKELTQYFNFYKELDINDLPTYVTDYVDKGETIEAVYSTLRDKCLFTDHKIVLFDRRGIFGKTKKIHYFPYKSISSTAIEYKTSSITIHFSMDSGYQLKINFVRLTPEGKTKIRLLYSKMMERIDNKL